MILYRRTVLPKEVRKKITRKMKLNKLTPNKEFYMKDNNGYILGFAEEAEK
jgi:hypothetical protein